MSVIFIPVKETRSKLNKLSQIAQKHLLDKTPLLFLVADQSSFDFIDKLLWTTPAESFLPHPTHLLSIGFAVKANFPSVFNLQPKPITENVKIIFEFEDHTSPEKLQLSEQKYQYYRDHNFPIVMDT